MFSYFPTNYPWDLAINIALDMGACMGEIDEMCAPLKEAAKTKDAEASEAFRKSWELMADKLCELAKEDEDNGRLLSAGDKYARASTYYCTAERLQGHGAPGRMELYQHFLTIFAHSLQLAKANCERVEIPYEGKHLSALYVRAEGVRAEDVEGKAPVLVMVNGLDSTKEMIYRGGLPELLAKRGVSSLIVDQPGTGEAIRLYGLTARFDAEHWASRVVDWLETREEIDAKRIGMEGISLGGYFAPRAVAFEPRFACGVVWGANHDWRDVQKRRLEKEGNFPVPHYWKHVCWVWGAKDIDEFMEIAEQVHLDGVLDRVKVPFLVTHGEQDSQIPLKWAHRTYEELVNSPKRELKVFTEREGGVQHSSCDNSTNAGAYIADWVAETLNAHTA
jgi:dienelactone hydrolase